MAKKGSYSQPQKPPQSNQIYTTKQLPLLNTHLASLSLTHSHLRSLSELPYLPHLHTLDLSHNQISELSGVQVLPKVAPNLGSLDMRGNPMLSVLNVLLDLAFILVPLPSVTLTVDGGSIELNDNLRIQGSRLHQQGHMLGTFLDAIERWTKGPRLQSSECLDEVQDIAEELAGNKSNFGHEINQTIFYCLSRFISLGSEVAIQALGEYTVASPIQSDPLPSHGDLLDFYYAWMVKRPSLQPKLVQELEVEEQLHQAMEAGTITDPLLLLPAIPRLWHQQLVTIEKEYPDNGSGKYYEKVTPVRQKNHTPLTSPQTKQTTTRDNQQPLPHFACYFGLDLEWARQTQQFVLHRLLSLLRQCSLESPEESARLTFQPSGWMEPRREEMLSSPVSRNKFLLSSCLSVLEAGVTRIIFNRLLGARTIKQEDIVRLQGAVEVVSENILRLSFRRISQAALYYGCLYDKMKYFKMGRVLSVWKNLRKRKVKLFKRILSRKTRKEKAFLSVVLAQWRITARTISTHLKLHSLTQDFHLGVQNYSHHHKGRLKKSGTVSVLRWPAKPITR